MDFDSNCFSILTKNRSLDLRHEDVVICRNWCFGIKYLTKKTKSFNEIKKKKLKELKNRKEIISDFWRTEILPKWSEYRKFIILKDIYQDPNSNSNEILKKRSKFFNFIFANNNSNNNNINNNSNNNKKSKNLDNNVNSKQDVVYLWTLGIPEWLRKKFWALVITNSLGITENLFNFYIKNLENNLVDCTFDNRISIQPNGAEVAPAIQEEFDGIPVVEQAKLTCSLFKVRNTNFSEMKSDINKCYKNFKKFIDLNLIEELKFKEDLYKILTAFMQYRLDVQYAKQITYIATIFYLNSEDYFQTFICLANFLANHYCIKFMNREEAFVK